MVTLRERDNVGSCKNSLGGASSGVSLPGGRTGNCMYSCRLTCTLPTGIASSRLSLPSHTVMTRSVCRFERRTGNTNALPFPFDGQDGLALLYTIPVTACAWGGRGMAAREAGRVEDEGHTFSVQYTFLKMADIEKYQKEFAPSLQADHKKLFGEKYTAFRTVLEIIA